MVHSNGAPTPWSLNLRRYLHARPSYNLGCLAFLVRLISWVLLYLLRSLPAFDTSAEILQHGSTTLRWDVIHFAAIAKDGYQYEQQIAFQPGWPLLLRLLSYAAVNLGWDGGDEIGRIVVTGEIVASASYVGATIMLYKLTRLVSTHSFALTTSLLYLFSPAPAVMSSAMSEPFFAFLTFVGFYLAVKRRFILASLFLAGATSVRATGVMAVGPVAWMIIFKDEPVLATLRRPFRMIHRAIFSIVPICIIFSPFALAQTYFYLALCQSDSPEAWCRKSLPLAYSHIQEKYWNVGLLNYWTLNQLPNLLLALPVLSVALAGAYRFFRITIRESTQSTVDSTKSAEKPNPKAIMGKRSNIFIPNNLSTDGPSRTLLPLYIHSSALTLLLIFSAHTQIALRVCVTDPVIWWSLANLAFSWQDRSSCAGEISMAGKASKQKLGMTRIGKIWVWWSVIQGAISIVLWAGHYPPA